MSRIDYDPFALETRRDPLPVYARLRDADPAHYMEKYDAWALSRFQDIWDAGNDAESYSVVRGTTPAQLLTKDQPVEPMLNVLDPPEHTRLRARIRKCFLPAHVRGLEPLARKLCHEILDANWDKGEIDVVGDFAGDLSVSMACLAIGLPVEDGPMLSGLVQGFFRHEPDTGGMTKEGLASLESLKEYCGDAVRARRRQGSKSADALAAIATHEMGGRELSEEAAASHLSMLVIGGSETFPKVLANGVRRLWEHPDQRAMLASEPARIPDAFDEILRFDMPTQLLGRTLRKDVSIHGRSLREGQAVFFLFAAANRDEREFPNPDAFDTQRRPKRILSFGAGTHQCLGTHVARMEGRVALGVLLERMPSYEVDLSGAGRHETEFVQGFSRLSLRFET